jgi:subtilisin family serine protease
MGLSRIGMDVINMSLGSPFGRSDDPAAQAATNAARAGVIVVASAGNEGANPYMTGSPASADGAIAVAANDPLQEFPGASLALRSTGAVDCRHERKRRGIGERHPVFRRGAA